MQIGRYTIRFMKYTYEKNYFFFKRMHSGDFSGVPAYKSTFFGVAIFKKFYGIWIRKRVYP